jgi:excisionase family DNA binding protein
MSTIQTAPSRMTVTVEEAAQLLGIGRQSAYQAARTGELPTIKLGRRLLVPRAQLDTLLGVDQKDERPEATTPGARETSTIARQEGDHVGSG